jgi:uncharacterized protein (DUF1684 family)
MNVDFNSEEWQRELEDAREEATDYFLNQFSWRGTPEPEGFGGPKWFAIDEKWRVPARLDREAPGTGSRVKLQTSVGSERDFDIYGTFVFEIEGQEGRLTAYRMVPEPLGYDELFVPFTDATTGKETYGAGRYLDVERRDSDEYVLDFNRAYNPLCAFSPRYNCPYPPPQNRLAFPVEAGEKVPFEH